MGGTRGTGLAGAFSIAIGAALVRGRRPDCHCFGRLHSAPAGWPTLTRNVGLAALAGVVVWLEPGAALTVTERLVVLGGAAVFFVFVIQAWLWLQLVRQNGRILVRLQAVEEGSAGTPEDAVELVGSPAPAFDLPTVGGTRLTLAGLRDRGRPVLLIFSHARCGPCQPLAIQDR